MTGPRSPRFLQVPAGTKLAPAAVASRGLLAAAASIPPKFFYDALGSRLFDAITELAEYYPTRTEAAIFEAHGEEICRAALALTGPRPRLLDLGAGNCAKAARLFAGLAPSRYVAVDISADFLHDALIDLQRHHPAVEMLGVGHDFSERLALPPEACEGAAVVFYPGSSIGNFAPEDALRLLREARAASADGALLIGVDLVKPRPLLEAAYDDELGVTAAFNLNVLRHLNRLLGADFELRDWRHVALYNESESRIEMHLEAVRNTVVRWRGGERCFVSGERIHTENSYKWSPEGFAALLRRAGFGVLRRWTDERGWFGVWLAGA
jgi:dimethylhistidine N-methyltransferase